jgi:hypothetical protein
MRLLGLLLLAVGTVLIVAPRGRAQEPSGPHYKHLQPLEIFIGNWRMEGQTADGVKLEGEETSEWIFDKNSMLTQGWYRTSDNQRDHYRAVTRWAPEKARIVQQFSVSNGEYWERVGSYDPDAKVLSAHETSILPDGTRISSEITVNLTNPDRLDWKLRNSHGSPPYPDLDITLTRVVPTTEPHHEAWLDYLTGPWEFTFEDGRTGSSSYHRSGTTPAVVFHGETEGFSIAGIMGWHPDSRSLVEIDHFSPEPGVEGTLHREFPEIGRHHLKGRQKYRLSNGQSGQYPVEYRRLSDDEMTLTGTPTDAPPWVVRFRRMR